MGTSMSCERYHGSVSQLQVNHRYLNRTSHASRCARPASNLASFPITIASTIGSNSYTQRIPSSEHNRSHLSGSSIVFQSQTTRTGGLCAVFGAYASGADKDASIIAAHTRAESTCS
jgi:hypothetical protein